MSEERYKQPLRVWLPKVVLTFLIFLLLLFVVYQMTVGMGAGDLGQRSMWALIVVTLLPVVDRVQILSVSPGV
jgi:hypothetical protein